MDLGKKKRYQVPYRAIPYAVQQGIYAVLQGIKLVDQGGFGPDQGIPLWPTILLSGTRILFIFVADRCRDYRGHTSAGLSTIGQGYYIARFASRKVKTDTDLEKDLSRLYVACRTLLMFSMPT
jgi:hypothetical protein